MALHSGVYLCPCGSVQKMDLAMCNGVSISALSAYRIRSSRCVDERVGAGAYDVLVVACERLSVSEGEDGPVREVQEVGDRLRAWTSA